MLLRLRNAAASMAELAQRQDATANNLANATTAGFRRVRTFTEALNARLDAEGAPVSDRRQVNAADLAPGTLEATGNPLDVALGGEGFFVVEDANGQARYTRTGTFSADPEGTLRLPTGEAVLGDDGVPLAIPQGATVAISGTGEITADGALVGRLQVVTFEEPLASLQRLDGTLFGATAPPIEVEAPDVRQGFIEGANVDPIREMTDMIAHFRLYEAQQKSIQTADALLGSVARDMGRF